MILITWVALIKKRKKKNETKQFTYITSANGCIHSIIVITKQNKILIYNMRSVDKNLDDTRLRENIFRNPGLAEFLILPPPTNLQDL